MTTSMKSIRFCALICFTVITASFLASAPVRADESAGVDFFITADTVKANPSAVPINSGTTADFTVDLGVKNANKGEDAAPNVKQQSYTVKSGSSGVVDSVVANGTTYTPSPNSNSYTFTIAGGNSAATFGVVVTVHYTANSTADDDKVISMNGTVTFNDTSTLNTTTPDPTETAAAVDIDSLSSDATQTNVNQNVTIGATTYGNNWAAVKTTTSVVSVTAKLKPDTDNAAGAITWSGGTAVAGHPRQRTVDKTTPAVTGVTVTCGANSQTLYVWIIWGSYEIRISGPTDQNQVCTAVPDAMTGQPSTLIGPPNGAGIWEPDTGRGHICGTLDHGYDPQLTYSYAIGKTQGICSLTPAGIGKIVASGSWAMKRYRTDISWVNGGHYSAGTWMAGAYDNSTNADDPSGKWCIDIDPSDNDKIYDADTPGLAGTFGTVVNHTAETYDNFMAYATVTLDTSTKICNQAVYNYEAQVDMDAANHVVTNRLSLGTLTIPTQPKWSHRSP